MCIRDRNNTNVIATKKIGNSPSKPNIAVVIANSNDSDLPWFVEVLAAYKEAIPMIIVDKKASERLCGL